MVKKNWLDHIPKKIWFKCHGVLGSFPPYPMGVMIELIELWVNFPNAKVWCTVRRLGAYPASNLETDGACSLKQLKHLEIVYEYMDFKTVHAAGPFWNPYILSWDFLNCLRLQTPCVPRRVCVLNLSSTHEYTMRILLLYRSVL